jgi:hypothetical protein
LGSGPKKQNSLKVILGKFDKTTDKRYNKGVHELRVPDDSIIVYRDSTASGRGKRGSWKGP